LASLEIILIVSPPAGITGFADAMAPFITMKPSRCGDLGGTHNVGELRSQVMETLALGWAA
jgi:hypothetical protein